MRFKNSNQRKAVMAKLKNKNFSQIRNQGVFLKKNADTDMDGVKNIRDCKPLDPQKQGRLHDWQLNRLKKKEEALETRREAEQKKLEDLKDTLKVKRSLSDKHNSVEKARLAQKQAVIDEINREEKSRKEIEMQNKKVKKELFDHSLIGKTKKRLDVASDRWNDPKEVKRRRKMFNNSKNVLNKTLKFLGGG